MGFQIPRLKKNFIMVYKIATWMSIDGGVTFFSFKPIQHQSLVCLLKNSFFWKIVFLESKFLKSELFFDVW